MEEGEVGTVEAPAQEEWGDAQQRVRCERAQSVHHPAGLVCVLQGLVRQLGLGKGLGSSHHHAGLTGPLTVGLFLLPSLINDHGVFLMRIPMVARVRRGPGDLTVFHVENLVPGVRGVILGARLKISTSEHLLHSTLKKRR